MLILLKLFNHYPRPMIRPGTRNDVICQCGKPLYDSVHPKREGTCIVCNHKLPFDCQVERQQYNDWPSDFCTHHFHADCPEPHCCACECHEKKQLDKRGIQ